MSRIRLAALLVAALASSCFPPPSANQQVMEAARELNVHSRFGRLELAATYASPAARAGFLERRATWGEGVRVMDVEIASLTVNDEQEQALVEVLVTWMRMDESSVRATRIAQVWREKDNDWLLVREKRVAGDVGLFGEATTSEAPAVVRDVQFPTTVLR